MFNLNVEHHTTELLSTTIDATQFNTRIAMPYDLIMLTWIVLAIFIACVILFGRVDGYAEGSFSRTGKVALTAFFSPIILFTIYAVIACQFSYGTLPGYNTFIEPQFDSASPHDKTIATVLHNEIAEEVTENQAEFNKLGLIEYCRHTNELTDNNAESILCGGNQLTSVATDKAIFRPEINTHKPVTNPHSVKVSVTVDTELK